MPFEPAGWRQKVHYVRFAVWVLGCVLRSRPNWIYASDPLSAPAVWLTSFLPGVKVVYHEHDSPARDVAPGSMFQRIVMRARRALARRSELCVLPNAQRSDVFSSDTGRRDVLTVWNCPMSEEVVEARRQAAGAPLSMRVLYHGSIVPSRLPATVIEALAELPDAVSLDVVGYETVGHSGYVDELKVLVAKLGLGKRVTFHGSVPERSDLMRICRTCDIGLSLQPVTTDDLNQQMMTGASNKPFDYLACGLALLVSNLPDWREMYADQGFALVVQPDSASSIAQALRWYLEHPAERLRMGEGGRTRIATEWNYERQFAPVLARMQRGMTTTARKVANPSFEARS
jgi:glycosyltransferase involved in cell wall biosynthesis